MLLICPLVIETVAVAVVPIPTPIDWGAEILIIAVEVYPLPALTISKLEIVPAALTTAVIPADTGSEDPWEIVSKSNKLLLVSSLKNCASSKNISVELLFRFFIIFAEG